ncbi:transcriptional regulator Pcc1 [Schizosaccharomyces japonicus yFS275]|uniref:Transcriptional regulator Pcc1 n=1 Tax=Schizosaccharomyces japonicus (strain yFS275 / FY16936) TaxID=402676 RepID=B6K1D7_SCHJY|nr:transcriptional regulator Pcc1 [Schizosaccharomyces japonicus yFS275]EEB07758.2 transcriptional regulator Pcc1 [Schizosaccharomyces japonicus yFS275]
MQGQGLLPHKVKLAVPFLNSTDANRCLQILQPDHELREDQVKRRLSVDGSNLIVEYECSSAKMTRVTMNTFFENLHLIVETMNELSSL